MLTRPDPPLPRFLYGTAWKEDQTRALVELAISQGFRGIDTANQRRHYNEAAVGEALAAAIRGGLVIRNELFLQTKFTFRAGQDHRLPYDPRAPIAAQVEQSFASSLEHLQVDHIDSYVLHGPSQRVDLGHDDWEAWRAMEQIQQRGAVGRLGISNVSIRQLEELCGKSRVQPAFVQNCCYASTGWDREVRRFCVANQIVYQGFSLLTANRAVVVEPELVQLARKHGRTACQIVFCFALTIGMLPLTGTTSAEHMREDLAAGDFQLTPDEIHLVENLGAR